MKGLLIRTYIIQTAIQTLIGLSVTSCRISESTSEPELDLPVAQETQDARDDNESPDTSAAESAGVASLDMIDSGVESGTSCEGDLCDQQCEIDEDCDNVGTPDITFYCDLGERRCKEGCREGDCPEHLVCNLEIRLCYEYPCTSTADCSEGQYCESRDLVCRPR